jgi:hypothetical protein
LRLDFCALCGAKDHTLEHHHFIPKAFGGSNDETNMFTVCSPCHGLAHNIPRPFNLGDLVKAGQAKAQQRTSADYQEIAERRQGQADRAAEAAKELVKAERRKERAELRRELLSQRPVVTIQCEHCNQTVERKSRKQRYCSAACKMRAARGQGSGAADSGTPAPVSCYAPPEKSNDFNGAKTAKTPAPTGISGPLDAVEGWRKWERIVSTDGVVSYATFVGKDVVAKCGFGKLAVLRAMHV